MRNLERVGSRGSVDYRARRRERERQRRQQAQRAAASTCGWCYGPITPRTRGPIPKWCSATCRHRAWEQARAAASGRAAVQIVERRVEVRTRQPLTRRDWPQALQELAQQLHDGRIYDRDLAGLSVALAAVLVAYHLRAYVHL